MKNTQPKPGWLNRHIDGLPEAGATIRILSMDFGAPEFVCTWHPFDPAQYTPDNMPGDGYLGTARTLGAHSIGFHAWAQNDSEFVFYRAE